jgi:hypothetical protein
MFPARKLVPEIASSDDEFNMPVKIHLLFHRIGGQASLAPSMREAREGPLSSLCIRGSTSLG